MAQKKTDTMIDLRGPAGAAGEPLLKSKFVKVRGEFTPGASRAAQQLITVSAAPDDILEIEFEDRQRVWMRVSDYRDRFGKVSRDAPGAIDIGAEIEPLPAGQQLARGPLKLAIKALKVLGVDLAGETAEKIAQKIEAGRAGLVRCIGSANGLSLEPARDLPETDDPWLLLIHGTGSSTAGSFTELWKNPRWTKLLTNYGNRVLAFDHETLSKSPIQNVLALLEALPAKAKLHLLTHSRGGLVGEILCRAALDTPFSAQERELYPDQLRDLNALMNTRKIAVDRFVRVACPALGTTLASGRLDRWFSVIGSVCGNALPGTMAGEFISDMGDFITAVIHERTDPKTLPGLEAMMPESPFIQLVNWPNTEVPGDLAVISGDIEKQALAARLLIWVTDRFYDGDHDLVVNTASMYGGVKRSGSAVKSFHKGHEVSHFNYFRNDASLQKIVEALSSKDLAGFEPLVKPRVDIARAIQRRSGEPLPVVFVLPGIMGSELAVDDDQVWLDIPDLVFGGLKKLHIKAKNVRPVEPLSQAYGSLIEYLAATHKVVPFPFDWRLPVQQEADRLAKALQVEFDLARRHNQPVRILAHSMGGLVARTMTARHQSLWREICGHPSARLVMLGTPNGGSHCITELLVARSSTLKKLSLIDLRHDKRKLLEVISRFPGVLAMLPKDQREDYFTPETWAAYQAHDKDKDDWLAPDSADLKAAREFRKLMDTAPVDPSRMVYLAGRAGATPAAMKLENGKIKILATARGDGSVTWESGIIPEIPTYYCNTVHGDLAADINLFAPIRDLLERGQTAQLTKEPAVARGPELLFDMPAPEDEMYPTREVLVSSALGAAGRTAEPRKVAPPVQVRVVHGHLQYASHPVVVGHYAGDAIVSAESHVNWALKGALVEKQNLGLYPGPIGTNAIFSGAGRAACPSGAIVVGLGTVGDLTTSSLIRSLTRALLEFAVACGQRGAEKDLGISALLIGTNAGGVSVTDSVFSVLQAAKSANEALESAGNQHRIAEIEFVEIWEDRALQAAAALCSLQSGVHAESFRFAGRVQSVDGGRYRVRFEEPAGWWQRLLIRGENGTLRFTAVTRRARSEVTLVATQRKLVDQFIEQSISTTQDNREVAKTLFELLLPNPLKDQAPDQDDMVLIIDEQSAPYPWELLQDGLAGDGKPFAVKHGLVRQLESEVYREHPRGTQARTALVVGDPLSSYPELKGAQEEALAVSRALRAGAFDTAETLIRPTAEQVIRGLYKQPYRVLHLAGHGVYKYLPDNSQPGDKPVTGMILGDGIVLSPHEVQQMRMVPELVFLNCCHLGHIEPSHSHRIAANVATEFIRIGVRAVVAAGWAVDDQAASTFARVFYEAMMRGLRFGPAVLEARKATYESHGSTNTWGAYQCYGDPDYQLEPATGGQLGNHQTYAFAHPSEAEAELDLAVSRLSNRAGDDVDPEREKLAAIAKAVDEAGWLKRGAICSALGRAYREAGLRAEAIRYFRLALNTEDGSGSLKDYEQVVNLEVRQAAGLFQQDPAKGARHLKTIRDHIRHMEQLVDQGDYLTLTGERLSILASAHKRLAMVCEGDERIAALEQMARRYKEAYEKTKKDYPLLNWLTAEIACDWQKPRGKRVTSRIEGFDRLLDEQSAALGSGCGTDSWSLLMAADAKLIRALAHNDFDREKIAEEYRDKKSRVSHGAFSSVHEQIDFLAAMAKGKLSADLAELGRMLR